MKQKIIIISGPTAVGKTSLSIKIAHKFNGEIIGADSMQIYKGMDIGTGKISEVDKEGIPHYLIDIVSPNESFSVYQYVHEAQKLIDDICNRKKLPIIVGGTGLYIKSLLFEQNFGDTDKDPEYRNELREFVREFGAQALHDKLNQIDPISAQQIAVNDVKKVIRALEIFHLTGHAKSEKKQNDQQARYNYKMLVLTDERDKLYARINRRVEQMFANGLIDEIKKLNLNPDLQSAGAIGYKELFAYLNGLKTLEETIEDVKLNSRRYAKRQLTFFRGMQCEKEWFNAGDCEECLQSIDNFLRDRI